MSSPSALRLGLAAWACRWQLICFALWVCAMFFLKPQIHRKIEQISINQQNRMAEGYISPLIRNQCCREIEGFATEMAAYFDYPSKEFASCPTDQAVSLIRGCTTMLLFRVHGSRYQNRTPRRGSDHLPLPSARDPGFQSGVIRGWQYWRPTGSRMPSDPTFDCARYSTERSCTPAKLSLPFLLCCIPFCSYEAGSGNRPH
jgi:hypothetical protein